MGRKADAHGVLAQTAAVGAILLCFAIVLDVGHLSTAGEPRPPAAASSKWADGSFGDAVMRGSSASSHADATYVVADHARSALAAIRPTAGTEHAPAPAVRSALADSPPARASTAVAHEPAFEGETVPALPPVIPVAAAPRIMDEPAEPEIAGLWAPDVAACSLRDFQQGVLPTIITAEGASAGETRCVFKNQKRIEGGWRVTAQCVNGGEKWTAQVRLRLERDRLVWESKRGRQVYARCGSDLRMAATR